MQLTLVCFSVTYVTRFTISLIFMLKKVNRDQLCVNVHIKVNINVHLVTRRATRIIHVNGLLVIRR